MSRLDNIPNPSENSDTSPQQLVKLLLAILMKDLYQAKGFMVQGKDTEKGICLGKAMDILVTLDLSVDTESGSKMSTNLKNLYQHTMQQLVAVNAESNEAKMNEVISLLGELKTAWEELDVPCKRKPEELVNE